mmetsp:Transcript_23167/g.59093  ORF Transcript_23167/g.59093 Transcript_23167/m.59093 type:complete len:209 (-) Transcript_23167:775-1401(-)
MISTAKLHVSCVFLFSSALHAFRLQHWAALPTAVLDQICSWLVTRAATSIAPKWAAIQQGTSFISTSPLRSTCGAQSAGRCHSNRPWISTLSSSSRATRGSSHRAMRHACARARHAPWVCTRQGRCARAQTRGAAVVRGTLSRHRRAQRRDTNCRCHPCRAHWTRARHLYRATGCTRPRAVPGRRRPDLRVRARAEALPWPRVSKVQR